MAAVPHAEHRAGSYRRHENRSRNSGLRAPTSPPNSTLQFPNYKPCHRRLKGVVTTFLRFLAAWSLCRNIPAPITARPVAGFLRVP